MDVEQAAIVSASLWRTINEGLGRGEIAPRIRPLVSQLRPSTTSSTRRSPTLGRPPKVVRDIPTDDRFLSFAPVTSDIVCRMVNEAVNKFSMKDHMPTWFLKSCIDLLAPCITSLFNSSLSSGAFPTCYMDGIGRVCHTSPKETPCDFKISAQNTSF